VTAQADRRYDIEVKHHAKQRAAQRFPGFKLARITDEVRAALKSGRLSVNRPDWLLPPFDHQHNHSLYAWTEDRERTYVLHTTETKFVVMSVMEQHPRSDFMLNL
jgi:hypothetical protein